MIEIYQFPTATTWMLRRWQVETVSAESGEVFGEDSVRYETFGNVQSR